MIDEKLREAMIKAYLDGDYEEAVKLSQMLDTQITEEQKRRYEELKEVIAA